MTHKVSKITHLFALSLLLLLAVFSSCREEEPMPVAVESVELNEYYLTLKVGERTRLKATVYPSDAADQRVVWESYDSDIADVDEHGYVTAYEVGSTIVCVQTVDGGYSAECQVEVLSNEIRVEGVRLSDDSITMNIGEEYQLTAEISPSNATNKNLVWKSSNTSVATVNKGKVKAIKSGNSTITVSSEDGEHSASCAVTVEDIEEPKLSWGLVGTFNNWGKSGNDIPMSDEQSDNYYVATEVSLNKSDSFAFRYDNDWGQSRGGASTGGTGSTVVFEETFAGCDGVMGWSGTVANGNFATDNDGWTVENAHGADGAAKFGASSKRGSAQTPALNFTGNATLTFKAGAWSGDQTTLNITMTGGTLSKSSITLSDGYWSEYEISITGATQGAKIKFEGVQTKKARFFLDDIKITQAGGGDEGVFDINEKYSTVAYDDDSRISVASTGTYDIYLAKSLDYFYIMLEGQIPEIVSVTGVYLDNTEITLYEGETTRLSYNIEPSNAANQTVKWESSNTNVATVNNYGKVTAISEGESIITVRTDDGGYTARCYITVKRVNWIDLSVKGKANCYVVKEPGAYKFTPTKGGSSDSVGTIASVTVLWESFGNNKSIKVGDLIKNVSLDYTSNEIHFITSDTWKSGNALIAAKGADDVILWSWHIWMTPDLNSYDYEFEDRRIEVLDRNLGATSKTYGEVEALGLMYQWGRKDPFMGASSVPVTDNTKTAKSTTDWYAIYSDSSVGTIQYAIKHPTTQIVADYDGNLDKYNGDWYYTGSSTTDNTRWSPTSKTIYDPCPSGWRVPQSEYDVIDEIRSYVYDDMGAEVRVRENPKYNAFYPYAGTYYMGVILPDDTYWTCTASKIDAQAVVSEYPGYNYMNAKQYRFFGLPIRCVRYENL